MTKGTMSDMERRGKEMQNLRRAAHLRQRDVADLFEKDTGETITSAAVSSWETGKSAPAIHRLPVLDEAYGANGAVLKLYGVPVESAMRAEVRALRERLNRTDGQVSQLVDGMAGLRQTVDRLVTQMMDLREDVNRLRGDDDGPKRAAQ